MKTIWDDIHEQKQNGKSEIRSHYGPFKFLEEVEDEKEVKRKAIVDAHWVNWSTY